MTWLPAARQKVFLSTLSLRRATDPISSTSDIYKISIHALLAESDFVVDGHTVHITRFLSTLSLRRATMAPNYIPRTP